ncbi:MAG: 16S rRNA (guanine(527)-N(7))-methyltransferase RsmG [Atribacterota bacterium]|nr:16S rRNA (guanine(527)-N(7))-methyltransferase RsmG [Atribacterota bacterium]
MDCGKLVEKGVYSNELEKHYIKYIDVSFLSFGIRLEKNSILKFFEYLKILEYYQKKINITAITDPYLIIKKHFLDSLSIFNYLKNILIEKSNENVKIIDVGSGAGFPGIPINIVFPQTKVILLEARKNKKDILDRTIEKLQLEKIETIQDRAENIGRKVEHREKYEVVLSRAVASLDVLSEYCLPLCSKNGIFIAYKGNTYQKELYSNIKVVEELGAKLEEINILKLPDSTKIRSILVFRKIKSTPDRYPRRNGIPQKRPLCF